MVTAFSSQFSRFAFQAFSVSSFQDVLLPSVPPGELAADLDGAALAAGGGREGGARAW